MDAAIWAANAVERLNDASFGEGYEAISSAWVRWFEHANNRRRMRSILSCVSAGGRLLEVGVGSGSFLDFAAAKGFTPAGCDLSPAICRAVTRVSGVHMHCGTLESMPPTAAYRVIAMHHVLEHVDDPVGLLVAARRRLAPDGVIQIAVPNVSAWEARLQGWNSYEPYHLLYFEPATLRQVVEKAGFTIVKARTHESFSGWTLAVLRSLIKRDPPSSRRGEGGPMKKRRAIVEHAYRLLLVAAGLITYPARALQARSGRGDEIVLLARHAG